MALPKNLIRQRFYVRSVKIENWPSVWARNFQSDLVFFDRTRTPFSSPTAREADDKTSFNKGEPIKLPELKIHMAFRNKLPIKNGSLIEAFSCFAGSNNDLSCYLACKILFNALLRLVSWQIHLPKPVYLSWVFCCLHAFITRQLEHVFRTNPNGTDQKPEWSEEKVTNKIVSS